MEATIVSPLPRTVSKTPYIIVAVIAGLILLGFIIWIVISWQNQTGPFTPYTPNLAPGLVFPNGNGNYTPPTQDEINKRLTMICQSWPSLYFTNKDGNYQPDWPPQCNNITAMQPILTF